MSSTTVSPTPEAQLRRHWPLAAVVVGAAAHAAYLYGATDGWVVDDGYISFRYVDNWLAGHGLVFNPGERVEGYTNFLWVVVLAGFRLCGAPLLLVARLLGVALSLGAVALLYRIGEHQLGRRLGFVPAAAYGLNHSLMTWSFGGLELPLFIFLLLLATYGLFVRPTRWALLALALAALTRPEGYLFLALGSWTAWRLEGADDRWRTRAAPLLCAAALVGGHLLFKLGYYGALLPNTFHAKVGFGWQQLPRGADYLAAAVARYSALSPVAVLLVFARRQLRWRNYLLAIVTCYAAYVVYAGGDPLPGYRLVLPLLPFAWLAILTVVRQWPERSAAATAVLGALLVASAASQGLPGLPKGDGFRHFQHDRVAECGGHIGRWFALHAEAGATLATNTAGSIPYFAPRLRVIDMLGLTDGAIAKSRATLGRGYVGHEKHDADYVLAQKPDYVLLCFSCLTKKPCLPSCKTLAKRRGFKKHYRRRRASHEGFEFFYWERQAERRRSPGP